MTMLATRNMPDHRAGYRVKLVVSLCLAALFAGCAHYPVNVPLEHHDPTSGYRLETLPSGRNSGSLLVVMSFSGGGTRAAALLQGERAALLVWFAQQAFVPKGFYLAQILSNSSVIMACGASHEVYLDAKRRPYIHLLDGALTDNTGLRALLDRILSREDPLRPARALDTQRLRKVVLIMVSAETRPDLSIDRIGSVPTPMQVVRNVKDTPINRYSFETIELFKAYFDGWAQRPREHPDDAPPTEFYLVEVTLDAIDDEQERDDFMAIPTSLRLPADQVDALRATAGRLLDESPGFQQLMGDLAPENGGGLYDHLPPSFEF